MARRLRFSLKEPDVCGILVTQGPAHDQTITANRTELTGWQSGSRPCRRLAPQDTPCKERGLPGSCKGRAAGSCASKRTPAEAQWTSRIWSSPTRVEEGRVVARQQQRQRCSAAGHTHAVRCHAARGGPRSSQASLSPKAPKPAQSIHTDMHTRTLARCPGRFHLARLWSHASSMRQAVRETALPPLARLRHEPR